MLRIVALIASIVSGSHSRDGFCCDASPHQTLPVPRSPPQLWWCLSCPPPSALLETHPPLCSDSRLNTVSPIGPDLSLSFAVVGVTDRGTMTPFGPV